MDKASNQESPKQIPIEERVILTEQEKTFYDVSLRQSYISLTNAGYEIGPDDMKKLEQGLKLVIEATRPLQDETNALLYFSQIYSDHVELNLDPPKNFYVPGFTEPYMGANHNKEILAYTTGTSVVCEQGDGRVLEMLLFPIPEKHGESLKFGKVVGHAEVKYKRSTEEYYYGPHKVTDADVDLIKKSIIKSGLMTSDEVNFFMSRSRTE